MQTLANQPHPHPVDKKSRKECQRLLDANAVTAQLRLAKYGIKGSPGFSIFVPGDLHANNLGDFLAVRYTRFLCQ
jgi:hypothetical protein